ncbi:inducible T-cell costimulator isoform X2 [Choloepus didactylus]|uniref:inducible T-cell costimulator isoform X2 n=1 Tax=Choloepus didactylus TaxID=27675 RepID=UPI00189C7AA6|nr:inducible T-cell costimulator isoform X2 [Choloepus didactylus]
MKSSNRIYSGEINDSTKYEMFTFHNGGVQIICKYPETVQQFKMQLLKGSQMLCELTKTMENKTNMVSTKNVEFCQSQLSNNSVSFFLYKLDSSHASYYFCKLSIFEPPPHDVAIVRGEYLHIYESQLCCQLKIWLPIGCAAFVVLYIFGCVFICWLSKKKYQSCVHEPSSEYMSMAAVNTTKIPGIRGTAPLWGLGSGESSFKYFCFEGRGNISLA